MRWLLVSMISILPKFSPICGALFALVFLNSASGETTTWKVGFAKVDITPTEPVPLSGYASRSVSHDGVADPISARAMCLSPADVSPADAVDGQPDGASGDLPSPETLVLISVDAIGIPQSLTAEIAQWVVGEYGIPRSQLVLSCTHSHFTPHLEGGLTNLYQEPLTEEQLAAVHRYTESLKAALREVVQAALDVQVAANLAMGTSTASFAANRRALRRPPTEAGGPPESGPVDSRVRVLQATTPAGQLLGGAFLYACHCTTIGGGFNQISGDWAGLAASRLEQLNAEAVFLPIIGCGADANPNPRGNYQFAEQYAAEMVDSVNGVLRGKDVVPLVDYPIAQFGYAAIVPEQPTGERLDKALMSSNPNERRWAEHMQQVRQERGRLPESYPMPIHTWQFGEALTWVFLGGEVVVDYQFRLEKEMPTKETWVASYSDDVFAYVASESMRSEGGYEVDSSMIYYLQPGRWESGTQDLILQRVSEIRSQSQADDQGLTAADALQAVRVPPGFRVELVASEPLVRDPINLAFGGDGRVWVVEMSDYPLGNATGGRITWLSDTNGDGQLDSSQIFLDGLSYPTSVMPWRDGVVVIAGTEVIYAEDRDGDGVADFREALITGLNPANPQHRASGFEIGLDGRLHFGVGSGNREIYSVRNQKTYQVQGHDVAWNPDTGELELTAGKTQFVRTRDAFGRWFGNSNSLPMFEYVLGSRYAPEAERYAGALQILLTPAVAPPVYPRSRTVGRFNDQFARDRFTSACSSIVARVPGVLSPAERASGASIGFVCEPVHNLVARIQIEQAGSASLAHRHTEDVEYDFMTSTDGWSRPVRIINAPDGTLWIVDMVRQVIEHPEWIPTAWQDGLDLRNGAEMGRIYRVYRDDFTPTPWPNLPTVDAADFEPQCLQLLSSDNGALRDLGLQALLQSPSDSMQSNVRELALKHASPAVRASALGCLVAKDWLQTSDIALTLAADSPELLTLGLILSETIPSPDQAMERAMNLLVERDLGPRVDLQWVLTSTQWTDFDAAPGVAMIAARSRGDRWISKALPLVTGERESLAVVSAILSGLDDVPWSDISQLADTLRDLEQLWARVPLETRQGMAVQRVEECGRRDTFRPSDILLMAILDGAEEGTQGLPDESLRTLEVVVARARRQMLDADMEDGLRVAIIRLIGSSGNDSAAQLDDLSQLLESESATVRAAAIVMGRGLGNAAVGQALLDKWSVLVPSDRTAVCTTLLTRGEWAELLLDAVESNAILPIDLPPATIQQLRSHGNLTIRSRAISALGKLGDRQRVVEDYLTRMPKPESIAASSLAGKTLYDTHCAACHHSDASKSALGPPIDNLAHWTLSQWVTAVLDPNQAVDPKYQQSRVLLDDGQLIAGIVLEQSQRSLKLGGTDGSIQEIATDSVEEIAASTHSLMPDGFEQKLTPQQIAELVAYLRSR
ncbi:PVC-type heme-binding CxxCH protein [Aureliella helgolandensis]|uniref:Cytochrome c n=1 Tax=Aureliella helgolandensis TaxID=2527968 RepID=A0A518G2X4_9BACT|nr:PVC-type heme-binding CxxCH protein [Aureliella helgolandensis]QDV22956.1 Cytochrome c [Aureliella helgolandensis]